MYKRIALFIVAHVAFFAVAAAIVAASTTGADAQSDNPYDMRFIVLNDAQLRAAPEAGSSVSGQVAAGTRDVVLRWCRPEFPFQSWMFGSQRVQTQLLNERVCEIQAAGQIGFIQGDQLRIQ